MKFSRLKLNRRALSAVSALMLGAATASASPSLLGSTAKPTGIDDLLIDGTLYNVAFIDLNYLSSYPVLPTFLGNQSGAQDASLALANAFNSLGVTGLDNINCAANASPTGGRVPGGCLVETPYLHDAGMVSSEETGWFGSSNANKWLGNYAIGVTADVNARGVFPGNSDFAAQVIQYAVYSVASTPSDIPEPTSVVLAGLGLSLMALARANGDRPR
jgi:hypothetical protein